MASLGKHPNYNITTSVSVYVTYPSDEKATITFDYTSVVGTYTSVLSSGVKVKTVCNGVTKGADAIVGCRNSGDWDSAGTYTKSHSFDISRTSSDQSISFTAYALTQGEATIGSYSDSVSIKAKPVTTIWNDINVLNPNDEQDMLSAYFDLSYSTGYSASGLLNEPTDGNAYQVPGTIMTISNIRPYYDYYELDTVVGATSIGNGKYQHTMTEANQVVEIHMKYKSYTVTYDANGGSGAPAPQSFVYNSGSSISSTIPTRFGYTFINWKCKENSIILQAGQAIPQGWGAFTLIAQWEANTYTITYNANGGENAPEIQYFVYDGGGKIVSEIPKRSGYKFLYWIATSHNDIVNPGDNIPKNWENVTLIAQWEEEIKEPQNIYICKNGYIYARDFVISEKFYLDTDGTIYAPAFNIGNQIYLDKNGLTAAHFIKGLPANAVFITLTDKRGNALIDANNTILIAH